MQMPEEIRTAAERMLTLWMKDIDVWRDGVLRYTAEPDQTWEPIPYGRRMAHIERVTTVDDVGILKDIENMMSGLRNAVCAVQIQMALDEDDRRGGADGD